MSESSSDEHTSPSAPVTQSMYETQTLDSMLQLFDEQRQNLLRGLQPNRKLSDFDLEEVKKYISLVLTGTISNTNHFINSITPCPDIFASAESVLYHDVDSALIFRQSFPWRGAYDILTTFAERKSLAGYLHAHVRFNGEDAASQFRDPGGDPNIFLAVCGPSGRHRIHLMLPDFQNEVTERVTDTIATLFPSVYAAMYSAIQTVAPEALSGWQPTYEAEQHRAAQFSNRPTRAESRKCIPRDIGELFGNRVMRSIRRFPWGTNAYWFIQVRGSKDDTRHAAELTDQVIDHVLHDIIRHQSTIFLDVGLELHLPPGWACMPARGIDLHPLLAQKIWGIDMTSEWEYEKYDVDVWAGLADVAGFRCNFASAPLTANRISYVQVYSTDKFATYNSSSATHYKAVRVHPQQILKMASSEDVPSNIIKVYEVIAGNQLAQTPTVTRMEARVPLAFAKNTYNPVLTPTYLAGCLHAISVRSIWAWRVHRILACYFFFRLAATVKHASRKDPNYLTLVLSVVYIFNAIHSRPGQLSADRKLTKIVMNKATVGEQEDTVRDTGLWSPKSTSEVVPYMDRGAIMLPPIQYPIEGQGDVLRLGYLSMALSESTIAQLFGMKWEEIRDRFTAVYRLDPYASGHLQRRRVKKSDHPKPRAITLPPGRKDLTIAPVNDDYYDHADDLPPEAMVGSAPQTDSMLGSTFFLGLCTQILQRVGCSGDMSYSRLSGDEWHRINFTTFQDLNLSSYFTIFQYPSQNTDKEWRRVRSLVFPETNANPPALTKSQGWPQLSLYVNFLALRAQGGPEFEKTRIFMWDLFDTLDWFPQLTKDRLYRYELKKSGWIVLPAGSPKALPIIINPKCRKPVTCIAGRPPVLDRLEIQVDHEVESLQRDMENNLDPLLRDVIHVLGGMSVGDDDSLAPQNATSPPEHVVAHVVGKLARKQGGRTIIG